MTSKGQSSTPKEEFEQPPSEGSQELTLDEGSDSDPTRPKAYRPPHFRDTTTSSNPPRPPGKAKIIPCDRAPTLSHPKGFITWKSRFLNFVFSIDPLYRRILDRKSIGNFSHEEQLYNAIAYAVAEVSEALGIVNVLFDTDLRDKGSRAWKNLHQRYDRVSESKVQRILESHRRPQGNQESLASYLQRYQIQHEELKRCNHPHTERTTITCMLYGLRAEFGYINQHFRIHKKSMEDLTEAIELCLELYDDHRDRALQQPKDRSSADRNPKQQSSAHYGNTAAPRPKPTRSQPQQAANPQRSNPQAPNGNPSTNWRRPAPPPECEFCGKTGHIQSECYQYLKFKKQVRNQQNQHKQAHFADSSQTNSPPSEHAENSQAPTSEDEEHETVQDGAFVSIDPSDLVLLSTITPSDHDSWILDSGATDHCSSELTDFTTYRQLPEPHLIHGICCNAIGKGTVQVTLKSKEGQQMNIVIKDVLHVPELRNRSSLNTCRLLSLSRLQHNSGSEIVFSRSGADIRMPSGQIIAVHKPPDTHLYYLLSKIKRPTSPSSNTYMASSSTYSASGHKSSIIHQRLGHQGQKCIRETLKTVGMTTSDLDMPYCNSCAQYKSTTSPKNKELQQKPTKPFTLVGVDIWTPNLKSLHDYKYAIGFIDYTTNFIFTKLLQRKSEAPKGLQIFLQFIKQHQFNVQGLRLDNDKNFKSATFQDICQQAGITCEYSSPHSPHQNGHIERSWRTLYEICFTMLNHSGLDDRFWEYAFNTAVYIYNRTWKASISAIPYSLLFKKAPPITHFKVFGCPVFSVLPDNQRSKSRGRAERGIFVGYSSNSPAYIIYNPKTNTTHESRSVSFDEEFEGSIQDLSQYYNSLKVQSAGKKTSIPPLNSTLTNPLYDDNADADYSLTAPSVNLTAYNLITSTHPSTHNDPTTYKQALSSPSSDSWITAIKDELNSLVARSTWRPCLLPAGKTALPSKWVFKTKTGPGPLDEKKKARLVVKGFKQSYGIDYDDTYAPTVRMSSIRLALSHAAASGWDIQQVDINTAFLYAPLEEEVYMQLPAGIELISNISCYPSLSLQQQSKQSGTPVVAKLLRALYGLKQAPRAWHQELTRILDDLGYRQTYTDPGVYFHHLDDSIPCILLIYVDDILILSPSKDKINQFKRDLSKTVDIKDLGKCKQILGVTVNHGKQGISLSQESILSQLLTATGMHQSAPAAAPMTFSYHLSRGSPA